MSKHPSFENSERGLHGWLDANGITIQTKNGIVRSDWLEQMHYLAFTDSLSLTHPLLDPFSCGIFPEAFNSRDDWLQAKAIITANVVSMSEFIKKNGHPLLKLSSLNRVR